MSFFDGFEDEAFSVSTGEILKPIQIVNPKLINPKEISAFGLGHTVKNCAASNFEPPTGWELVDHQFSNGSEKMYICQNPRLVIIAKTPIYVKHQQTGVLSLLRETPEFHQDKEAYKRFNYNWVFILDENNKPCHPVPLAIKAQGASGTVFNLRWLDLGNSNKQYGELRNRSGLCYEIEYLYAQRQNKEYQFKNSFFHAHCIYNPFFEAEIKGVQGKTNLCAIVTDYAHPTAETLKDFMIEPGSEFSQLIKACQEEYKNWHPRKLQAAIAQSENRQPDQDDFDYYEQQEHNISAAYTSVHPVQPQFSSPAPKQQQQRSLKQNRDFGFAGNPGDDIPF